MCHSHVTKKAWHLVLFTFPQFLLIHHPDIIGIGSTAPFESLKILSSSRMIPLTGPIAMMRLYSSIPPLSTWFCLRYPQFTKGGGGSNLPNLPIYLKLEVMNLGFTRFKELPYKNGNSIHFSQRSKCFTQLAAFAEEILKTYKNSVVDCSLPSSKTVRTSIMGKRAKELNIDYPFLLFSNHLTIRCSIGCCWRYNLLRVT